MRHRIGIPPLGQHGHRHHTADGLAEPPLLADGVHDLAQQVLVGQILRLTEIAGAFDDLTSETLDFVRRHRTEVVVQRFARFELLAVNQQRVGAGERVAVLIEVAKQRQATVLQGGGTVFIDALEA